MSTRDYEAMFILNHAAATADFEETAAHVDQILEKHGATIVHKEKWDERKLAYEIKGQRRGTYYLTYFQAAPDAIVAINEDVQLNEVVLRHLVIALDMPIDEHIEKGNVERERMAEDSRKNSLGGWGGGRRERRGPPPRKTEGDDAPKSDAPKSDAPKSDAPKSDGPAADAPKAESAKAESAKAEPAKADATPTTDAAATE